MDESVTGFETEDDWRSALAETEDLDDLEEALDEGEEDEDELTDEEGSPPSESEGDDPSDEPEADAEAEQEADADGEEQQEEPEEPEPEAGEPEDLEAEGEPAPESTAGDQDQAPEQPEQQHNGELTLRADGTEIHLEGSMSWDHGVYIPMETLRTKLQPMLADRRKLQSEIDRMKAQVSRKSDAEVEAEELVKGIRELLADKDAAWEFFENYEANAPLLTARAEAARHKARADGYEQERTTEQQEAATKAFQQWAPRAVDGLVDAVLDQPEFKDLGLDRTLVAQQVRGLGAAQLFYRAAEDDPANGIRKGDIRIRPEPVLRHVQALAQVAQREREAAAAVRKAKAANERKKGKKRTPPPAVSASGTPVPGEQEEDEPQTHEEWVRSLRK